MALNHHYCTAVTTYLTSIVGSHLGFKGTSDQLTGANWGIIFGLRMHDESSYMGLDVVEVEIRRRAYWLAYGSDKSHVAVHNSSPFALRITNSDSIDDEFLQDPGGQPGGKTSVIFGFHQVSRLFDLLGRLLDLRTSDNRKPPRGIELQMRLNEVDVLLGLIGSVMDGLKPELQLPGQRVEGSRHPIPSDNPGISLEDSIDQDQSPPNEAHLVQAANIYVTQLMARFVAIGHRDSLLALQTRQLSEEFGFAGFALAQSPRSGNRGNTTAQAQNDRDRVTTDLLHLLDVVPLQLLAVNSAGMVNKIRFVAVALLDILSEADPEQSMNMVAGLDNPQTANARREAAMTHLGKYPTRVFDVLSRIEALNSLEASAEAEWTIDNDASEA
ncbi:hypothetical protein JCM24511_04655 [Saitozyma sp. JCM 24511]|nr:hypothetical protein JCM24511_04655 [Saitozyma sp. JCM 24511]